MKLVCSPPSDSDTRKWNDKDVHKWNVKQKTISDIEKHFSKTNSANDLLFLSSEQIQHPLHLMFVKRNMGEM